jgi:hypothetical protein
MKGLGVHLAQKGLGIGQQLGWLAAKLSDEKRRAG